MLEICVYIRTVIPHTYRHPKHGSSIFFFLSDSPTKTSPTNTAINEAIHIISKIMKILIGSDAEAEIGSAYITGQDYIPIRTTLVEMGRTQPPIPIQVDNTTALIFADGTIKQKRSKSINMNFYWLQDRTAQG